jgi:hypothetical protein
MTDESVNDVLQRLNAAAQTASIAEEDYRREAMARIKELERARSFAYRRLNLMTAVANAMAGAEDRAEATAAATGAFLNELNWNGASESQRQVADRFMPVIDAIWQARAADTPDSGEAVERELAAFEKWFDENRDGSFLSQMDGEVLELPLVEV